MQKKVQICDLVNHKCTYYTKIGKLNGMPCMFTFREASKPYTINMTSQT